MGLRALVGVPNREAAVWGLIVGFPIDVSGRRTYWHRETSWAVRAAEAQLAAAINEARARAREAYIEVATADAMVRATGARVETAREVLSRVRARFEAQAATALDVALSERELGEAEADHAAARRDREEAAGRLRELLNLPPTAPVVVEPIRAPTLPEGLTRESAIARALRHRREPAALAASAMRLRLSSDRLRAQALDPLFVAGEFEWQGYQQSSFGASVQWSLPLFQLAQGERAVALAEAAVTDVQRTLSSQQIARETATAWDVLVLRLEELSALEQRAVPALERALALTEEMFDAGAVDYFRVLLARHELATMRIRQLQVAREAWRARVALDRAMGGP